MDAKKLPAATVHTTCFLAALPWFTSRASGYIWKNPTKRMQPAEKSMTCGERRRGARCQFANFEFVGAGARELTQEIIFSKSDSDTRNLIA